MKIFKAIKLSALIALVFTLAVGCTQTPTKEDTAAEQAAAAAAAASKAIEEAKASVAEAKAAGAEWRDTGAMIEEAEKALAAGDTATAIQLANKANRQAQNALAQQAAEKARLAEAVAGSYTVESGDSLWRIAGRADIYANPFHWPLIYKANRDQIKDADLIYPGQVFSINRAASESEINAAVDHARNRGAWALGAVEDSDMAYLAR